MVKSKDLVCIVFNYNAAEYLTECLESIIKQETRFCFEIVIIDDFSEDNSKQIYLDIKKKYDLKNIYFFSTKKNTKNSQGGLKKIIELKNDVKNLLKAKYIYRINSDDYIIDKNKFEKQISFLEKNKNLVGVASKYKILKNDVLHKNEENVLTGYIKQSLIIKNIFFNKYCLYNHTATYIYRNIFESIVPPIMLNFTFIWGDNLLNYIMMNYGPIFVFDEYTSAYRINEKGIWTRLSRKKKFIYNKFLIFKIFFVLNFKHKLLFIYNLFKFIIIKPLRTLKKIIKKFLYYFKNF